MGKLRALLGIGLVSLAVIGAVPSAALAQNTPANKPGKSALAVSPAIVEHILTPGKSKQFTLRVTNLTDFPLPISGSVKNFITLEQVISSKNLALYDASKWFTITEPDFILQPKQTRAVSVSISPPSGSEPGGHYATVYFQPLLPAGALTPSTAYLSARVGSLAFLIVPGALDERLIVQGFKTTGLQQSSPIDFTIDTENSGNVHLSPNGKITLTNIFSNKAGETTIRQGVILPGTKKTFNASFDRSLPPGRYTATATITYGAEQKTITKTEVFWIIPWVLILGPFPAFLAAIVAFRARGRWKRAWFILRGKQ